MDTDVQAIMNAEAPRAAGAQTGRAQAGQAATGAPLGVPLAELEHVEPWLWSLMVPIDSLVDDPTNARKHSPKQLGMLKKSLQEFLQQKPCLYTPEDRIVRNGNGILRAAREMGWKWIAAAATTLELGKAKAFAVAENRASDLADWDYDMLASGMKELENYGLDTNLTGFELQDWAPSDGPAKAKKKKERRRALKVSATEERVLQKALDRCREIYGYDQKVLDGPVLRLVCQAYLDSRGPQAQTSAAGPKTA